MTSRMPPAATSPICAAVTLSSDDRADRGLQSHAVHEREASPPMTLPDLLPNLLPNTTERDDIDGTRRDERVRRTRMDTMFRHVATLDVMAGCDSGSGSQGPSPCPAAL